MRYIGVDKLKNHALGYVHTSPHFHYGDWDNMCVSGKEIDEIIDTCPTADVVEVKHGEWCNYEGYCECSLCHHKYVNTSLYCPNCGAKMDGERREE